MSTFRKQRIRTPHRSVGARVVGSGVTLLLAAAMAGIAVPVASAAPTVGDTWSSSFENNSGFTESTTYAPAGSVTGYQSRTNVSGPRFGPGSLLGHVTGVAASAENAPGEVAANAADASASTKWLAFVTAANLVYTLDTPQTVKKYSMTTANDASARNPKNWTIQGSNDNSTWTTLDTQTNQLTLSDVSASYGKTFSYTVSNTTAYKYYKIDITALNGSSLMQLADWEIFDGTDTLAPATPMTTVIGSGPVSSKTAKSTVGFTGMKAMRYGGAHTDAGVARDSNVLYSGLNLTVGDDSELSYLVYPMLDENDLQYPSNFVAVDVEYTDANGSNPKLMSSNASLTDQYGYGVTPQKQGEAETLYPDQWNKVRIDLSTLAGKKITKVLLSYGNADGKATTKFNGWLDDIAVGAAPVIDNSNNSLTNYVDTRRGTNSSGSFSRGNNIPATAWPNGFNFFVPYTDAGSTTDLYKYQQNNTATNVPQLQGIGISHEPSRWMSDRNQLTLMPSISTESSPNAGLTNRQLAFSHDNEKAQPDEYSVDFNNGIQAKVTPTDHAGVFKFTFPASANTGVVFLDQVSGSSQFLFGTVNKDAVTGWVQGGGGSGVTRMYHSMKLSQPATSGGTASGRTSALVLKFDTSVNKTIEISVATSFISVAQATKNLTLETAGKTYDQIQQAAQAEWQKRLGVISVEGATDVEKVSLYSNLYRLNLYPNSQYENTGTAATPDYKYASPVSATVGSATDTQTNAVVKSGKLYVNNGFWDTYRTAWPLYEQLYPSVAADLIDGFVQQYRDGGWISRWSSPGYSNIMTGTSSDAAFAQAYIVGSLPTSVALEAYDAALKNATALPSSNLSPNANYGASDVGRKSLDTSIFLGYTPVTQDQSVSWGLEGLINDYAIGQMAKKLSTDPATPVARRAQLAEEAKYFEKRSEDYANLFDPSIGGDSPGFFQGRWANGNFLLGGGAYNANNTLTVYNPTLWGLGENVGPGNHVYTETDGWNFAFHAPYDIDGLAGLHGGQSKLIDKLDAFFDTPETAWSWRIHETFEARDVRMGQWGGSNQVSFHIPYLYSAAGKPAKTQALVREALGHLYVGSEIGQGYPGDEDNGAMASFYIYSALGFYPLSVGSGNYTIGSPLYDKAVIKPLGSTDTLTITANNNSHDNVYIQSATLNGAALNSSTLTTAQLTGGNRTLTFNMGSQPSTWGDTTLDAAAPTPQKDLTKTGQVSIQASDASSTAALNDDSSMSTTTFSSVTPAITVTSLVGKVGVNSYTLTNGATGASPKSWDLYGSNDGSTWTKIDSRTNETFKWNTQTRPFELATTTAYSKYKLSITATSTGAAPTIAEIELLTGDSANTSGPLDVQGTEGVTAVTAGSAYTGTVATVTGGGSSNPADFTATVDFGEGPVAATLTSTPLGALIVSATNTFTSSRLGPIDATVTVVRGSTSATATVKFNAGLDESTAANIARQGNVACFTETGTAADCDANGYAYDKVKVRAAIGTDFGQDATFVVGGVTYHYTLPNVANGQSDTIFPAGQTVPVQLEPGATKISVLGMANEGTRATTITLNFTDGSTQSVPVQFGDWTGAAASPISGNVKVFQVTGRTYGTTSASHNGVPAVFATTPVDLDQSGGVAKTVKSITFAAQAGGLKPEGQVHVMAIATNGTPVTPLAVTVADSATVAAVPGIPVDVPLATATGGRGSYQASVNWGDGTSSNATVSGASIAGQHTYAAEGTYTVTVTAHDGEHSQQVTRTVQVTDNRVSAGVGLTTSVTAAKVGDSVTLTASVAAGATGTVQFQESGVAIGAPVAVAAGKATLTVPNLTLGSHFYTAAYSGDGQFNPEVSAAKTVDVTAKPADPGAGITVSAPAFSQWTQAYGATGTTRTKVRVVVTGATSGTVTFKAGSVTLGKASVVKSGSAYVAETYVSSTLKVGSYAGVKATLVTSTATKTSSATAKVFKVVKAKTSKVTVSAKKFKKGTKPKVTVRIAKLTNGQYASGKVKVYVGKKVVKTAKISVSKKGKVTVTLPKRYRSTIKVKAKFVPKSTATVMGKTSKVIKVKTRR